jgi:hypothetical protein
MEAKDTVMDNSQMRIIIMPTGGKLSTLDETELLLEKQSEISFKAGMKEVIDFIKARPGYKEEPIGNIVYLGLEWERQMKEWGIEL